MQGIQGRWRELHGLDRTFRAAFDHDSRAPCRSLLRSYPHSPTTYPNDRDSDRHANGPSDRDSDGYADGPSDCDTLTHVDADSDCIPRSLSHPYPDSGGIADRHTHP